MSRYADDAKERVRDAVDMIDLVSAHTELRRAGPSSYQGLCPFHEERTPSFSVDPLKKLYHCFVAFCAVTNVAPPHCSSITS